jgi:hypothetical protein
MTDFTLSAGNFCRPWSSPWGAFPIRTMKLSTGISTLIIRVGTVVGLDVNSTAFQDCIVPSSLTSTMAVVASTAVVGVSAEGPGAAGGNPSSTNSQGTLCQVWEANPHVEFVANTRNGLLNSTCVGQMKELCVDSTLNITLVNIGASSLATPMPRVIVTSLLDNSGDSGGRVTFRFVARDATSSLSTANLLAFFPLGRR